ncbi:MAG: fused MFS/spermidine synthase [Holophagaceae bacterium]
MNDAPPSAPPRGLLLPSSAIGLGAFLLFQVQPLLAKRILPWFGGSAAVWTACMLFFQVVLLLGYTYAHLLQKLPARRQAWVHGALLLLSLAALPVVPSAGWKPVASGDPTWRILGLLGATVGLPYLLLSSTSPLVQRWLAQERPGFDPYRLFALSNAGSMAALLSYPVLVEPFLRLDLQAWGWSAAYGLYVLAAAALAWRARNLPASDPALDREPGDATRHAAPGAGVRLLWVVLAFAPSVLLLGVTSHLSTNVAPIPFLWVLPLALYLLSFILCFDHPRWYARKAFLPLAAVALAALAWLILPDQHKLDLRLQVGLAGAALFIVCMAAHGELVRLRPAPRHLTGFYLSLSLGGALGGVFAGLVAPRVFDGLVELPIGLMALAGLAFLAWLRDQGTGTGPWLRWSLAAWLLAGLGATVHFHLRRQKDFAEDSLLQVRNFYGTLRIREVGLGRDRSRYLLHGTINHGGQFVAGDRAHDRTTYYGPDSGVGLAIEALGAKGPLRVGVVGLGSGTLLNYGRPGDLFRVYEINPLVERIARTWFVALPECQARTEVALGDARLSLEAEPPQRYDLLAVDAFSSDAIPVHLLTREAFDAYARQLRPGGVLAVHISNRYLDLAPVVKREAEARGWQARLVSDDEDTEAGVYRSDWVLVSDRGDLFQAEALKDAAPLADDPKVRRWTDDFSNLYRILK